MIIEFINRVIGMVVFPLLIIAGTYLFFRIGFIRMIINRKKEQKDKIKPNEKNGISPFRALTVALAGTLGVGNIVGVATAVRSGGPGAVFWMWISACFAMVLKYSEITLAVSHRRSLGKNGYYGGAAYYIRDIFASAGSDRAGAVLAVVFTLLFMLDSFATGNVVQINAAARAADSVCGIPAIYVGIGAALITFVTAATGTRGVSALTGILIPVLTVVYITLSAGVLILRSDAVIPAFGSIMSDAFAPESAFGGVLGFLTCRALRFGTIRGLLSNEAGCGTAPTAHAEADVKSPSEQGMWGVFEVFIDTMVLCTLTGLIIIINNDTAILYGTDGIMAAISAYSVTLGSWSGYILAYSVAVFGLATLICRAHYGTECVRYLLGGKHVTAGKYVFLLLFCATAVYGSVASPDGIWGIADFNIGAMTLINVSVLLVARKEITMLTRGNKLLRRG